MNPRLSDLLAHHGDNYILPFFWQHGETEEVLRREMAAIQECGIQAVCVEARPHPDFAGPGWWHDMDIIMEEARSRNMRVWILDDAHFPTGYANGALAEADPELCKQYLFFNRMDVLGPLRSVEIDIANLAKYSPPLFQPPPSPFMHGVKTRRFDDDRLLAVLAARLVEGDAVAEELLDLTAQVHDGRLLWDAPAGAWRVFVLYLTRNGGGRTDYINVIDRASCRVQIDAVYEPHYAHYKDDFGQTLAGFFSDEPLLGNTIGFNFDERIGHKNMPLPWNTDVPGMLAERLGDAWVKLLPALWTPVGGANLTGRVRYAYMDTITRLVQQNFSNQLGEWCAQHGVEYIGHIIEDGNQSSRLGCSMGHFFRALDGQHMAGIDDIGGQVLPGGDDHNRRMAGDGEFYHFLIAKLASSHAHIDPKKAGRAMCEIYGAYGWNENVAMMKWITDHFVVNGVNYYVPHAFSPKEFPDRDCPPHFYAHGRNPQYRHFGYLMRYLNRLCHLFSGGRHLAPAALLYHGEADWSGEFMVSQKPARQLLEAQIDYDILPADVFADPEHFNASLVNGLQVNGETYRVLVIPYSQFITRAVAEFAAQANGCAMIFVDRLPEGICDEADPENTGALIAGLKGCAVIPLNQLGEALRSQGLAEIELSQPFRRLRYYHYQNPEDIFMFFNEDTGQSFDGWIDVPARGSVVAYDGLENVLRPLPAEARPHGTRLHVRLEPYQSLVAVFGETAGEMKPAPATTGEKRVLTGDWNLSLATALEYPNFHDEQKLSRLESVAVRYPHFSGFMRYENSFTLEEARPVVLEIENVYDAAEAWVNGQYAGMAICPPYRFNLSGMVQPGVNVLRIEVANTLDREVRALVGDDPVTKYFMGDSPLTPSGIIGEVRIYIEPLRSEER